MMRDKVRECPREKKRYCLLQTSLYHHNFSASVILSFCTDIVINSPGQYPSLSVVTDSETGPNAQQRQHSVFSLEFDNGTIR